MRLEDERESDSVEDRRGGGMGRAGGLGIGTILVVMAASYFLGVDPRTLLGVVESVQTGTPGAQQAAPVDPRNDPERAMVSEVRKVLAKTEDSWEEIFREAGAQYRRPVLVLYRGSTPTACGAGQAAMGPFYCPGDEKVYLDLAFFDEMARRFRVGGDFARAYVIAHEIGHHVQRLTGITEKTDALRARMTPAQYNRVSVRVELQADCLAGVWANRANRKAPFLDPEDIGEALAAANAIGDDALQRQARGTVMPDSFTHGTSAQRMRWFRAGFDGGSPKGCDSFAAKAP
jgi:uncharacterized protein